MKGIPAAFVAALTLLLAPAGALAEETPIEQRVIPDRINAGGVAVGGMVVADAAESLEQQRGAAVRREIVVRVGSRRLVLKANRSEVALDAIRTAKRAYFEGLRYRREADPDDPPLDVGLAITYSEPMVGKFVAFVQSLVGRRARSARIRIGISRISRVRARNGIGIDSRVLERKIGERLTDISSSRQIVQVVRRIFPAVSNRQLARRHPAIITIDRRKFRLRLFKRLRLSRSYGIALGAAGFETPSGFFRVRSKQVDPPWHAPNRPWAGAYAGTTVPGGAPNNPLKARWLGLANGVGIHGTSEEWSIGTMASHGCIRMRVADVIDLYPRVPVGTTVRISR